MRAITRLATCAILSVTMASGAQANELLDDFSTPGDTGGWAFDFGSLVIPNVSQNPTEGSPGNALGALQLDMFFNTGQGGNNRFAFTDGSLFFPGRDLTGFDSVDFDLKIADGAALDAFGNHGFFEFVSREGDGFGFNSVLGQNLAPTTGVWIPFSVPTDTMTETRAFTIQLYGGPSQDIDGQITLFIDNIRLVVPEPSSALLACMLFGTAAFRRRA